MDLHLAQSVPALDGYHITGNEAELLDAQGTPINEDRSGLGGGFSITLSNKKGRSLTESPNLSSRRLLLGDRTETRGIKLRH